MIKVAILGCGNIADSHAAMISRIADCEIVGVCDREELMAKQLCERFSAKEHYSNVDRLLDEAKPDIVHITTPPQVHFELGKKCLEAGCHLYIEKPFTVNSAEAEELIKLATTRKLKVTVGHDDQFTHATRRMREMIKQGYLGGVPVHMESYYCYDLGFTSYAKALLGDKRHWIRALPGTLIQNNISHGICRIAEFMPDDNPEVIARGFVSPFMKSLGEYDIIDEVRVIITGKDSSTAYFTFSSQMRPTLLQFRVYGPKNGLMVDHVQQTLIKMKGQRYKSYLERFVPQFEFAAQYAANSLKNIHCFLKNDFHMKSGMKFLIESFYRSVVEDMPPPIPYREIMLTSRMIDSIIDQIGPKPNAQETASS